MNKVQIVLSTLCGIIAILAITNSSRAETVTFEKKYPHINTVIKIKQNSTAQKQELIVISEEKVKLIKAFTRPETVTAKTLDIDGDGIEEILLTENPYGNCCAPRLSLLFLDEDKKFQHFSFDEWSTWNGWDAVNFSQNPNSSILTHINKNAGMNTDLDWTKVSYDYDGSRISLMPMEKLPEIPAQVELRASMFEKEALGFDKIDIQVDLNGDGVREKITCRYWERWGSLAQCEVIFSNSGSHPNIDIGSAGKRLGVVKSKKNGWHELVMDHSTGLYYDKNSRQYKVKGE